MNWYLKCFKQYADFAGRARRKEYWMFTLFNLIIGYGLGTLFGFLGLDLIGYLYSAAVLIPSIAVGVRRLHDIGKCGWWYLIAFVPVIGTIWLIVLLCLDGVPGSNQWGPNPKEC